MASSRVLNHCKRFALPAGSVLLLLCLLLAWHLGWFSECISWQASTGWSRIPDHLRPRQHEELGDHPSIGWLGHSGFVLDYPELRIALDPNLSNRCSFASRRMQAPLDVADLGDVDLVLLSHSHRDHLDLATLKGIPRIGMLVVPTGASAYLPAELIERTQVRELAVGESLRLGALRVYATAAVHHGSRNHPFASTIQANGYVLIHGRNRLYFAGDTALGNHLEEVRARFRPQMAILPIGAYSPRWPLRHYHLSPADAVIAARRLGDPLVIPCHFGTFTLSLDRPDSALPLFAIHAGNAGLAWSMPVPHTKTTD